MNSKTPKPKNFCGPANASSICPWCLHYQECQDGKPRCQDETCHAYDPDDTGDEDFPTT
jgi:hypothetical protein